MLGTDILNKKSFRERKPFEMIDNPWNPGEPVVLLPALMPDVSIIHAHKADEMGNVIIEGFTTHETEMVRASKSVIVSCEELISSDEVRRDPDRTTIPYIFVDAVVEQPWGAYPTSTYKRYELDEEHLRHYQACARAGGESYREYLQEFIFDCPTFDDYLKKAAGNREAYSAPQRHVGAGVTELASQDRGMDRDYALDELMVVEASRYIEDGDTVLVGTGLPMVAKPAGPEKPTHPICATSSRPAPSPRR